MRSRFAPIREHLHWRLRDKSREEIGAIFADRTRRWERELDRRRPEQVSLERVIQPDSVIDAIIDSFASSCLTLHGPVGTGKTFTALAIYREHIFHKRDMRIVSAADLAASNVDTMIAPSVLILDDLGVAESSTGPLKQRLFQVFDQRWDHGVRTIVTTNLGIDEFAVYVGDRVFDRIDGPTVLLQGPSRRRIPVDDGGRYRLDDERQWDGDAFRDVVDRVSKCDDEVWKQWVTRLIDAGLFELLAHDASWADDHDARYLVPIVHELLGHHLDDVMFVPTDPFVEST